MATLPHLHQIRVYYEDTDFSGFVYHASYLKFLERGRTEYLRVLGISQSNLSREQGGLAFVVRRMTLDYKRSGGMDDELVVATRPASEQRGASLRLVQDVMRGDICLVHADVTVAAVRDGRAVRLPDILKRALAHASQFESNR